MVQHPPARLESKSIFHPDCGPIHVQQTTVRGDHPPHDHDFHELAVIQSGRGSHQTFYGDRELAAGDVLVLRPGYWHAYRQCRALKVWNCCLATTLVHGELAWMEHDVQLAPLISIGPNALWHRGILEWRLGERQRRRAIEQLARFDHTTGRAARLGRLLLLFDVLAGAIDRRRAPVEHHGPPHPAMAKAARLLAEDRARRWTLDDLSKAVGLNRSYLVRLFGKHYGTSPISFLHRLRGERAGALLAGSKLPIAEVGAAVGWDDPNYFSRRFRRQFGCSPSDFRKRRRGGA